MKLSKLRFSFWLSLLLWVVYGLAFKTFSTLSNMVESDFKQTLISPYTTHGTALKDMMILSDTVAQWDYWSAGGLFLTALLLVLILISEIGGADNEVSQDAFS